MGMQMYLVINGRILKTGETFDDLQDAKADYPKSVFEVWADKGKLYAQVKAPETSRIYGTRIRKEN